MVRFLIVFLIFFAEPIEAAVLKPYLVTDQESVRLSDVFDGLSTHENIIVAPAPKPGQKMVYAATWIKNLAQQYQVSWSQYTPQLTFTVERKGMTVDVAALEAHVIPLLRDYLSQPDISILLDKTGTNITVSTLETSTFQLENVRVDPQGDRFQGILIITDAAQTAPQRISLTGRLLRNLMIPVLNREIKAGEVIAEQDIIMKPYRSDLVSAQILRDPQQVINHEPNFRTLPAGEPLKQHDLKVSYAIRNGEMVTMVLKQRNLVVSAKGKAMDNAKLGDMVRVINIDSKKMVSGIADKNHVVRIPSPHGDA